MDESIRAIVNADDLGGGISCTDAIYQAYRKGLITDTTILANGKSFDRALDYIKTDIKFGSNIGVHINLTQGYPLSERIKGCPRLVQGNYFTRYLITAKAKIIPLKKEEIKAIEEEIRAQIQKCLFNDIRITHSDSHHHVHTNPQIIPIFLKVNKEMGIKKIRIHKNVVERGFARDLYYSLFNQYIKKQDALTTDFFGNANEYVKPIIGGSTVEIMVHPDYSQEGVLVNREVSDGTGLIKGKELETELKRIRELMKIKELHYSEL